jgi:GTP-binding protein Era
VISDDDSSERAGRVAIVGRPNVGKSTLLNALLGQKLAITAPRPGTTRSRLLGVYASEHPPTQIAFVDTPGLERPRSVLGRVLVEEAQASFEDTDALLVVVEASASGPGNEPITPGDRDVADQAARTGKPFVVALNKVDKLRNKADLLPKLAAWQERYAPAALVPISALRRDNLEPIVKELRALLPEGLLYDADFLTDKPERFFVAELIREAILHHTREEVPHSVAVQIEEMRDEKGLTRIGATIVVDKPSHKGIVIGAGGTRLKAIGTDARLEIEKLLDRKVFLRLFVKVEEHWTRDAHKVRRLTREAD